MHTLTPPLGTQGCPLLAEAVVDLDAIAHNVRLLSDRAGSLRRRWSRRQTDEEAGDDLDDSTAALISMLNTVSIVVDESDEDAIFAAAAKQADAELRRYR